MMQNIHFQLVIVLLMLLFLTACQGQTNPEKLKPAPVNPDRIVGGGCDGCRLMYPGMPDEIQAVDTTTGWNEAGQKLVVQGKIFKRDGKTPAAGVILYFYHTDQKGFYSPGDGFNEKARQHGHLRGWVKSDDQGQYAIYTIRPAPYPDAPFAAHIHPIIKEPGLQEYYIDEFVFDDDPLLTKEERKKMQLRGGNGILKPVMTNGVLMAQHDIILGLNIPDYPSL